MQALVLLVLSALSGSLTVLAFAPYRYFWLMPCLLGCLLLLVQYANYRQQRLSSLSYSPARAKRFSFKGSPGAFWLAYIWGLAAYTSNFHWIYNSLHDIAGLPSVIALPLVLLLPAYLAIYPALAVWITFHITTSSWRRYWLAFPALWTLCEWLRSWMLTGFPWGAIGYSQITESPLSGYAPIGGIHLVTYLLALCTGIAVWAIAFILHYFYQNPLKRLRYFGHSRLVRHYRPILAVIGIVAIGLGGHTFKSVKWTHPIGKPLQVALAQGNIPQQLKWSAKNLENSLQVYYQQVTTTNADIMLLPETAIPLLLQDVPPGYFTMLNLAANENKMALALGIPRLTNDYTGYLNAVIVLNSSLPTQQQSFYAKNHLVPFGEFVPLPMLTGWIYNYMHMPLSGFTQGGANQPPLTMAGQKIAFNICYEDSFGEELIHAAAQSTMMANVSNLAWFGKSNGLSQHLQLSQARALENGRFMLRATNDGMTAIIAPNGEVNAFAAPYTRQVLLGKAQGYTGLTPYMRHGNFPIILFCAAIIVMLIVIKLWLRQQQ